MGDNTIDMKIKLDLFLPCRIDFAENDPRWVGAWWLGYIVAGVGCFLTLLPMTGFPSDLPGNTVQSGKTLDKIDIIFTSVRNRSL